MLFFFSNQNPFALRTGELEVIICTILVIGSKPRRSTGNFAISGYLCHNSVGIMKRGDAWEKQVDGGIQIRERDRSWNCHYCTLV